MSRPTALWSLAGRVYHEAIFQGQMSAAGSNVNRLRERMEKDAGHISKQGRLVQVLGSFYLLVVAIVSVTAFVELRQGGSSAWNVLIASGSVSVQMLIQTGYLMMLTVLATAEILAPDLYRWLETLPFSPAELGTLRMLALAREFVLPLGVIVVATPLVAGIAGGSPVGAVVGLLSSLVHAAVTLGVAVLASWKMRTVLRGTDGGDRSANVARVVTMVVYGVGTLLVVFIMQIGTNVLVRLFDTPGPGAYVSTLLVRILALAPLPTAPSVLIVRLVARTDVIPLWQPLVGTLLYTALGAALLVRVRSLLRSGETDHRRTTPGAGAAPGPAQRRPLVVRAPRKAFRRQIRSAMTRDTQALISLIFPVILPLLGTVGPAVSGGPAELASVMGIVMGILAGGWMVIHGLTRLQFGSGGLEATLPVRERDRVVPRLQLAALLPAVGAMLPPLFLLPAGSTMQLEALVQSIAVPVVVVGALLLKLRLFGHVGRGSNPVVIDEVFSVRRFWKWVGVIGLLAVAVVAILVGYSALVAAFAAAGRLAYAALVVAVAGVEVLVVRRMFP